MFVRTQTNGSRTYLLIVDNVRVDGKVKQRVLHRLGRLDELLANGQLDVLIQSLSRFSEKLAVLGAHAQGDSIVTHSARIGPASIFDRLWQSCSIDKVLSALLADRRFEFSVERAIFLTMLHATWTYTISTAPARSWRCCFARNCKIDWNAVCVRGTTGLTGRRLRLSALGCPSCRREFCESLNGDVSEAGQNGGQVFPDRDSQPAAGFHNGQNGRHFRPGLLAPYVDPILPIMYTCT